MNYEKLKGGLIAAFAGTGLIVSLGLGSGVVANATGIDDDSAQTSPSNSTVLTEEQCTWFMIGAPTSITMVPGFEEDGETPLEYTGNDLAIEATMADDINVYSSGNLGTGTATTNSECSFYTPRESPVLTWSITGADFVASYEDEGVSNTDAPLDFELSAEKPLTIDLQEKVAETDSLDGTCDAIFEVNDLDLYIGALNGIGVTIPTVSDVTNPVPTDGGDRCETSVRVATIIQGIETQPAAPGLDYTWTGPTVQIVRSTTQNNKGA